MLSSCGLWTLEHRPNRCGAGAQLLQGMWDLHAPGIEPMSSGFVGRFFTTEPQRKPQTSTFYFFVIYSIIYLFSYMFKNLFVHHSFLHLNFLHKNFLFLKYILYRLFFFNYFFNYFFSFIFISWRLITLLYCSGFCHTLTWISHGFTCIPHPYPPSHLPLYIYIINHKWCA